MKLPVGTATAKESIRSSATNNCGFIATKGDEFRIIEGFTVNFEYRKCLVAYTGGARYVHWLDPLDNLEAVVERVKREAIQDGWSIIPLSPL